MSYFYNKTNTVSNNTVTVFVHNMRALSRHVHDIIIYDRTINNDYE